MNIERPNSLTPEDETGIRLQEVLAWRGFLPIHLLLIANRVIKYSARLPHKSSSPTEKQYLVASVKSAYRLPLGLVSTLVAGMIGAQFGSARSNLAFSQLFSHWMIVVLLVIACSTIVAWHRTLSRWGLWLNEWVDSKHVQSSGWTLDLDLAVVGFEVDDYHRDRLRVRSVTFLSIASAILGFLIMLDYWRLSLH